MRRREFLPLALGSAVVAAGEIDRRTTSTPPFKFNHLDPLATMEYKARFRLRSTLITGVGVGLLLASIQYIADLRSKQHGSTEIP